MTNEAAFTMSSYWSLKPKESPGNVHTRRRKLKAFFLQNHVLNMILSALNARLTCRKNSCFWAAKMISFCNREVLLLQTWIKNVSTNWPIFLTFGDVRSSLTKPENYEGNNWVKPDTLYDMLTDSTRSHGSHVLPRKVARRSLIYATPHCRKHVPKTCDVHCHHQPMLPHMVLNDTLDNNVRKVFFTRVKDIHLAKICSNEIYVHFLRRTWPHHATRFILHMMKMLEMSAHVHGAVFRW